MLRAWLSRSKSVTSTQLRRGERCLDAVIASFARSAIRLVVVKTRWGAVQTLCERGFERGIERDESLLDAIRAWLRRKNIAV